MTKTCLQCGAVQQSSVRVCSFCDSTFIVHSASSAQGEASETNRRELGEVSESAVPAQSVAAASLTNAADDAWRGELAQRLQAYRARRRKSAPSLAQSHLPFDEPHRDEPPIVQLASVVVEEPGVAEPVTKASDDFSFTIAIGRNAATRDDSRMIIDVSQPAIGNGAFAAGPAPSEAAADEPGPFPVASIEERRIAGLIDAGCLLFAYGGFLTLFGSLGGQFTLSKLSAAVCIATFVIVYLQYFALFTVFGGTTPGMMLRGLHVVDFSGEIPSPRQMLRRSVGYMLSAGTLFMGFVWALWDEDGLTWHDRMSHTCLAAAPTFADIDATHHAAHSR